MNIFITSFKPFWSSKQTNKQKIRKIWFKYKLLNNLTFVHVECISRYFGLDCKERCIGHCINNKRCDHVSRFCPRGCMNGYIRGHCNICKIWTKLLEGKIINNSIKFFIKKIYNTFELFVIVWLYCFFNALVLLFTACQPGYYGINCSFSCLPNCKTCRHTDGLCSCKAGWMGDDCLVGDCKERFVRFTTAYCPKKK